MQDSESLLGLEHDAIAAECRLDAAVDAGSASAAELRELSRQAGLARGILARELPEPHPALCDDPDAMPCRTAEAAGF